MGKQLAHSGIDRMMNNDTPADPSDDFIAILGSVSNGARAGYPQLTIPMGYNTTQRRTLNVSIHANAYKERDLLGVAYVIEQGTKKRQPASAVNPSMYRCADTLPAAPFAARGACNPDYESALALAGGKTILPFSLETESVASLQGRLAAGTLSSETLVKAYLTRIALTNAEGPALQAVRSLNTRAVSEAATLDRERATSGSRGSLHGIPVLLDDTIDAAGLPTTGGSIALQGSMPNADAALVAKLKAAGAIVLGKANVSELNGLFDANMPEGYSSLGGQVLLPSDTDKTVAGSSAGSAASTAAGLAALTIGLETSTDTAQLIAPAGVAGVVGLKPTVGLVSSEGVLPIAKSQDAPGPITRTVSDAATALGVSAGKSYPLSPSLAGKRVAVITSTGAPYPAAVTAVTGAGATTVTKTIGTPSPNPASIVARSFEKDLNAYLAGTSGGAGSLQGIVNYNAANPVEGLKYQQGQLLSSLEPGPLGVRGRPGRGQGVQRGADRRAADRHRRDHGPERQRARGHRRPRGLPGPDRPGRLRHGRRGPQPDRGHVRGQGGGTRPGCSTPATRSSRPPNVRLAPSFTNPSMFRCVEGSTFFSPHHCHPGDVLSPTADGPTETPVAGDVGGTVPATLSLTLGANVSFGAFVPGIARTYTASTMANVISTAGDAALTVSEPGRLMNGSFSLTSPLRGRLLEVDLDRPGLQRRGHGLVPAGHRGQRAAAHGGLLQDAHVHPVHHDPVALGRANLKGSDPFRFAVTRT